jgi:hypothetical protein
VRRAPPADAATVARQRALYERLGFEATNETRFAGALW